MPLSIGGKKISWWWVIGGVGGVGAGILYLRRQSSGSSSASSGTAASSSSATDPVTGLPYSQDNTVDPITGMTYLAEAQEYGSVAAAEAAYTSGSASSGYYNGIDAGYPTESYSTGTQSVQGYASNAQWSQAVTAGLTGLGFSSQDIAAALGLYFQGQPLGTLSDGTSALSIVQAAIAEYGPPPVGTYPVIAPPSSGGGTTPPNPGGPSSGSGTGSSSTTKVTVPNVVGDSADDAKSALDSAGLKWTTTGAGGKGRSYVVTSQSPKAGTKVATGTTVTINLKVK